VNDITLIIEKTMIVITIIIIHKKNFILTNKSYLIIIKIITKVTINNKKNAKIQSSMESHSNSLSRLINATNVALINATNVALINGKCINF
jgi:uncharacterized membrane protein